MTAAGRQPVLYAVACGSPPAGQLPAFAGAAREQGWDVCAIATPDALKFLDAAGLAELTGHPVRSHYKDPAEPDVLPAADVFAVAPATFNTINKWAQGISDTLAVGLLCEAVGLGVPVVAVPWPGSALARHPAFARSIATLRDCGVIFEAGRLPGAQPGPATFPWQDLLATLARLRRTVTGREPAG